jgi:glycosyltransferase involved in cell wall biosynthesis
MLGYTAGLRILHTNIGVYPERGGPPSVIVNLAAAQARLGHHVTIASATPRPEAEVEQRRMLDQVSGGQAVSVIGILPSCRVRGLLGGWGKLPVEADVVHIHELWNPFDAFVARSARMAGIPYVVTPHGLLSGPRRRHHWLRKRVARVLYVDTMLRRARFVQGLTEHERSEIAELIPGSRVHRVPNGFSALGPESAHMSPVPSRIPKPFLLFMGRIHLMKGVDLLIPAFEMVSKSRPDLQLVIAGPDDGALQQLNEAISQSAVRERVHVVGMAEGQRKRWLLTNAEVFLLPSRSEGFSVAILEALSMGVPAVISRDCHFPEAAEAGAALEVALDPGSIASAVETILSSGERRAVMSSVGPKFVSDGYTWDSIAAALVTLYAAGDCSPVLGSPGLGSAFSGKSSSRAGASSSS